MKIKNQKPAHWAIIGLFALAGLPSGANAEVREAKAIREVVAEVKSGDVIVFDLDNTVLEAMQTLGSDQWFEYQAKKYESAGLPAQEARDKAVRDFVQVHQVVRVQAVEAETPGVIRRFQREGYTVIGLTARSNDLQDVSLREVRSIGVDFRATRIEGAEQALGAFPGAAYKDGILFASGQNKGQLLLAVLRATHLTGHRILFIDDKVRNVANVDQALTPAGVANLEFRYGAADPKVAAFNAEVADRQWAMIQAQGLVLPDNEAE
jgi:FMN phosphatase YigB (HAD superfamily)